MIISNFFEELRKNGIDFYTGVPDSYLNGFCNYLKYNYSETKNVITANEGNAIALACGYYFATGKVPLIYMQNSGIGNAINPLLSLADKNVYSVPLILLIGWRGEPGTPDSKREQHFMQGKITELLLSDMCIPYRILNEKEFANDIKWALDFAKKYKQATALIVPNGLLTEKKKNEQGNDFEMSREDAIKIVVDTLPKGTVYVATTGRATRELYSVIGGDMSCAVLNIGAMGHASSIAMGIALQSPNKRVVCFDGDAAAIMHLGSWTTVAKMNINNFIHIILNNGEHESVGGQPSAGHMVDFTSIAKACGYQTFGNYISTATELKNSLKIIKNIKKAVFMDIRIHSGIRNNLESIDAKSLEMIDQFMNNTRRGVAL